MTRKGVAIHCNTCIPRHSHWRAAATMPRSSSAKAKLSWAWRDPPRAATWYQWHAAAASRATPRPRSKQNPRLHAAAVWPKAVHSLHAHARGKPHRPFDHLFCKETINTRVQGDGAGRIAFDALALLERQREVVLGMVVAELSRGGVQPGGRMHVHGEAGPVLVAVWAVSQIE
jgi:hypothetical protein